ncbi:hypothetical protein ABEB36_002806 [Hypothenemus hampei]|uniref:Glutathione peroxidase n=1 Tax=Hypothenemus hampei TaxID=57062 RepID=A0ABD1F708_HYPHA
MAPVKKKKAQNSSESNGSKELLDITEKTSDALPSLSYRVLRSGRVPIPASNKVPVKKKLEKNEIAVAENENLEPPRKTKKPSKKNNIPLKENVEEDDTKTVPKKGKKPVIDSSQRSIYDFKAKTIDGDEITLDQYKNNVCLIVNVASKCGHTATHYKQLVQMFDQYNSEKGLKILAFPCNQFGKQEPGDNEKISNFAKKKNVNFDMFEKIEVNGPNAHPLWNYLTEQIDGPKGPEITWNFTKFLIDKEGKVVGRYQPSIKPLDLIPQLEKLW